MSVEEDRAELARLEEAWMQAVEDRDMETLERLVAPEFRFMAIHLYPEPMTREQWMDAAREGYTIVSFAFESKDIETFPDALLLSAVCHERLEHMHRARDVYFEVARLFKNTAWGDIARDRLVEVMKDERVLEPEPVNIAKVFFAIDEDMNAVVEEFLAETETQVVEPTTTEEEDT